MEWALLYQALLKFLWKKSMWICVHVDDWTAEWVIIASNAGPRHIRLLICSSSSRIRHHAVLLVS